MDFEAQGGNEFEDAGLVQGGGTAAPLAAARAGGTSTVLGSHSHTPDNARSASFLGVRFDHIDHSRAVNQVSALAASDRFTFVVTPNVDHIVRLHRQRDNARLWSSYEAATLSLCDSRVLHALARASGLTLELVTGSDLTASLLAARPSIAAGAVIGGDETLMQRLRARYPETTWFHHAPPADVLHNSEAQREIVDFVERSPARLVFFAIGSPQSVLVCALIAERRKAHGVGLCVGASLEFLAGTKVRAPRWLQRLGLEWLFRLLSEPTRLWRRYLVEGPVIFLLWWRWRVSSSR